MEGWVAFKFYKNFIYLFFLQKLFINYFGQQS